MMHLHGRPETAARDAQPCSPAKAEGWPTAVQMSRLFAGREHEQAQSSCTRRDEPARPVVGPRRADCMYMLRGRETGRRVSASRMLSRVARLASRSRSRSCPQAINYPRPRPRSVKPWTSLAQKADEAVREPRDSSGRPSSPVQQAGLPA